MLKAVPKLIEVALPLDDINRAAAREKSIRHGHPSTLHLWWARRPLAAARAVLFAQLVDDPSGRPELFPTEEEQDQERERLFGILRKLVLWENTTNEEVLGAARAEIRESWRRTCTDNAHHPRAAELFDPERLPAFHDPFAGGGAIPLEAQRLGLEAHASDLNPVAVLINKAMIEIPPRFAGRPPVNPETRAHKSVAGREWRGAAGLADDVRYYGKWMRDEAERRIGHLYPKARITPEMVAERPDLERYEGRELTVIAWLWARTVRSPNPVFSHVDVPLVSTFMLSTKKGKEAYVEPVVEGDRYRFEVRVGAPPDRAATKAGTKIGRGASFRCLVSGSPMSPRHIRGEFRAGRAGNRLMAVVLEGNRERVYLRADEEQERLARSATPKWRPEAEMNQRTPNLVSGRGYGIRYWHELFTSRQLVALTAFSDLVSEAMVRARAHAGESDLPDDDRPLAEDGSGPHAYGEAVATYLGLCMSRFADRNNALCTWDTGPTGVRASTGGSARTASLRGLFSRQAVPMAWDYGEANPFSSSGGGYASALVWARPAVESLTGTERGRPSLEDAMTLSGSDRRLVSTDPPYYDNVAYADLSDFFYVWLRRSLRAVFPDLFATVAVPKAQELVAAPYRHGGRKEAERFFLSGMSSALTRLAAQSHPAFPTTIYYAFKQSEKKDDAGVSSTGWETFLDAVTTSGFSVTGTWPMRTELANRMIGSGTNALASSVVLGCRKRLPTAPSTTRRGFLAALHRELPEAIARLQAENIAPVDLAQAAVGPGMAIFTRYSRVLEADDSPMTIRMALALINAELDQILSAQDADYDPWTRFAITWFETRGMDPGPYGDAETLATARGVAVEGVVHAGILKATAGQARLLRRDELDPDWSPETDDRLTVWECAQHVARRDEDGGEMSAAALVARLGDHAVAAHALAYRLYGICDRKKVADEALVWNELVQIWPRLTELAPSASDSIRRPADMYARR
ncbi:MAG: DUF1156 domain-containing protein [Acidobacteria bacterium]|nr:DUF1156 domain-containing protein [Acidobacteriota bacterium]MYK79694.1 DUF1156 domain-containing protein [Acidobacteriota bacterium]